MALVTPDITSSMYISYRDLAQMNRVPTVFPNTTILEEGNPRMFNESVGEQEAVDVDMFYEKAWLRTVQDTSRIPVQEARIKTAWNKCSGLFHTSKTPCLLKISLKGSQ